MIIELVFYISFCCCQTFNSLSFSNYEYVEWRKKHVVNILSNEHSAPFQAGYAWFLKKKNVQLKTKDYFS